MVTPFSKAQGQSKFDKYSLFATFLISRSGFLRM